MSVDDGRVTIRGKHVERIQVLKALAEKLRFELYAGRVDALYMDLDIRRENPEVALHVLLAGVRYATEVRFNEQLKRHELESLSVGALDERYPGAGAATSGNSTSASVTIAANPRLPLSPSSQRASLNSEVGAIYENPPQRATPPADLGFVPPQNAPFLGTEPRVEQASVPVDDGFSQADALAALKSDDPQIRAAAIESVEPTRSGISTLAAQAEHDSSERNRALAVQQLGKGRGFEVTNALLSALDDSSKDVVTAALDALASTGDHTLAGRIESALKDPNNPAIREHLQSTLKTLENSVPMHTGAGATQTGASATQTGAQSGASGTQTGASATQTGASAAQTGAPVPNGNQDQVATASRAGTAAATAAGK